MNALAFLQLGVSLALGLLVGMQRERTEHSVAGVRTFPLMTLFGTVCALLSEQFGGWLLAAGLLTMAGLVIAGNVAKLQAGEIDPGLTTEVAAVLLYAVGALVVLNMGAAVIVGGVTALLLHLKSEMHRVVAAIADRDLKAIMQFVLISLVILPVLPNEKFGPYQVSNPFKMWLMVVLIVGINLSGYVAFKLLGTGKGTLVCGLLGGLISSTAATVGFARSSRSAKSSAALFATLIMLASAVVFVRVLGLIAAVAAPVFPQLAPPIAAMGGAMILLAAALFFFNRSEKMTPPEPENPAELRAALVFGALYVVVLLLIAVARDHFGQAGIYSVAVLSGLTDMDAITLSTSELVGSGQLEASAGWRTILLASLSNIVFKAGIVAMLGSRALLWRVGALFGAAIAVGGVILWLWR